MRKAIAIIMLALSMACQSQISITGFDGITRQVETKCDTPPTFEGGMDELYYYFHKKIDKDLADKLDPTFIYNRILIRVYVDTQGKIFFIKPITKTEPYISAIFKVLEREDFPAFNAGIKKGLKVNSLYIINLNFRK